MNIISIIKGITLIILNIYCFRLAFIQFKSNRYNIALYLIILGGAIIRIWCLLDPFLHEWDERYHALVAKNLILAPLKPTLYFQPVLEYDYKNWVLNHIWLHKQPLAIGIISISIKIFGNYEWAVRLPSLLFSLISIWLTYRIAIFITTKIQIALLAAFLHAINGFLIEIASGRGSTDHIDNIFFFFTELSIFLIMQYYAKNKRIYLFLAAIFLGCSFLTKSFPSLIVLIIYLVLSYKELSIKTTLLNSTLLILVSLCVYLPWQLYIFKYFPNEAQWENHYNFLHLNQAIEGHSGEWWWHINYARRIWNELIYLIFLWFIYYFIEYKFNKNHWVLLLWITIPYIFFSSVGTKMWAYVIFTAPAIFIIEAIFLFHLKYMHSKFSLYRKILFNIVILLFIRYSYERVKPFPNDKYYEHVSEIKKIKELSHFFKKSHSNKLNIVFGTNSYIECMFYHNNTVAYPYVPENNILDSLIGIDYNIYIFNPKKEMLKTNYNDKIVIIE